MPACTIPTCLYFTIFVSFDSVIISGDSNKENWRKSQLSLSKGNSDKVLSLGFAIQDQKPTSFSYFEGLAVEQSRRLTFDSLKDPGNEVGTSKEQSTKLRWKIDSHHAANLGRVDRVASHLLFWQENVKQKWQRFSILRRSKGRLLWTGASL